jgi:hypothetical protein
VKYILLIYGRGEEFDGLDEAGQAAIHEEYMAVSSSPGITGGAELQPASTATSVRVKNGETLTTDGPFAETKEILGGYFLFEADHLDAAIEVAARIPAARHGTVEIRPLVER